MNTFNAIYIFILFNFVTNSLCQDKYSKEASADINNIKKNDNVAKDDGEPLIEVSSIESNIAYKTVLTNRTGFLSQNVDKKIVSYEDMKRLANDPSVLIIDVRKPEEIKETGLIGKSINIPLSVLSSALQLPQNEFKKTYNRNRPNYDTMLIFTCKMGIRALKALKEAESLGFRNAKYYKGGWLEWSSKNK